YFPLISLPFRCEKRIKNTTFVFEECTICETYGTTRRETNINHTKEEDSPGRKTVQIEFDSQISPLQHSKHRFFIPAGIPGDGRCMFRSVVHGACLRAGRPVPTENVTKELADDLRTKVVNELIKRRAETEWFLEGGFETYVSHMQRSHVWGGEPELLMSSHVLKVPITVYMRNKKSKSIKVVAEYGQEYGKENPE
ncbi:Ovarian tumor, otubain, partial [Cynara cardunculus var. scolymus]